MCSATAGTRRPSVGTTMSAICAYSGARSSMRSRRRVAASPALKSGRLRPCRTRSACWVTEVCRYTTQPRSRRLRRFSSSSTAPPPVASTMRGVAVSASIASRSRCRKPASPSFSKMNGMSTPVRRSTSASLSWKGRPRARASWRPTALLPEPMGPTRKTLVLPSMGGDRIPKMQRPPAGGRFIVAGRNGSVIDVDALAQDLRGNEDHELILVVLVGRALEQVANDGDVAQVRHLGVVLALGGLQDAAEHHGLAVVHQHLGGDFARVDRGHVHPARGHYHGADVVVTHVEVEDDAVVRRDVRCHSERQHRLPKLDGGGAARGGLLVRNLHALLDSRLLLVRRDDARRGD